MNVQSKDVACKKQAIMQSMLSLIYEYGIQGTPMSLVAKNAGVAAGTIYHYFESKEDLMIQTAKEIRQSIHDNFFRPEFQDLNYYDRFKNGWIALAKFFFEHPRYLWYLEQYSNSPYAQKEKDDGIVESPFFVQFRALIEEGKKVDIIRQLDTTLISIVLYGCIISTVKCALKGLTTMDETIMTQIFEISWESIHKK
ncbi:TetR/AcrR family transcriptional regulator [Gynurincola endophyticus]|uniref:TetR/AcrR family transcriptional regulator n=1 Tax=Gynurincola endophyticus TaxID=2479004 RepID=UPI000F8DC8F0|nr:TetR/AcrR family transcriptional regulator [Gynurincola endophyticus]